MNRNSSVHARNAFVCARFCMRHNAPAPPPHQDCTYFSSHPYVCARPHETPPPYTHQRPPPPSIFPSPTPLTRHFFFIFVEKTGFMAATCQPHHAHPRRTSWAPRGCFALCASNGRSVSARYVRFAQRLQSLHRTPRARPRVLLSLGIRHIQWASPQRWQLC